MRKEQLVQDTEWAVANLRRGTFPAEILREQTVHVLHTTGNLQPIIRVNAQSTSISIFSDLTCRSEVSVSK